MTPPGKQRLIGAAHPLAAQYCELVAKTFPLSRARDPGKFLQQVSQIASREAYEAWKRAYQANDGTFLDHICWGADRYLGDGQWLYGAMDDRFASNAARVFCPSGLNAQKHVAGKVVCVVGAWDGTESLLLRALGAARVDAVEEVPEFCAMAEAQYDAWDVPGVVENCSLYELDLAKRWQAYDLVYVPGVLYHLTDLVAAVTILWSLLRPGAVLAFESIAESKGDRSARYLGAKLAGWNWWSPTADCYHAIMVDCGFRPWTVELERGRGWWVGVKGDSLPVLSAGAAGFSRPDLLRQIQQLTKGNQ